MSDNSNVLVHTGFDDSDFGAILDLYEAVNWTAYTKEPEQLKKAFQNSSLVQLAYVGDQLVGLSRSMSDEVSIHYLQDILVHPDHQHQGIGRILLTFTLDHYQNVRTHMILTDDEEKQLKFYESIGYKNTKDLKEIPLNAFVKMAGVELK
jgi:ribosomal protein S18 acetylase RimI-like enzyme